MENKLLITTERNYGFTRVIYPGGEVTIFLDGEIGVLPTNPSNDLVPVEATMEVLRVLNGYGYSASRPR